MLSANGKSLTGKPYTFAEFAAVESDGSFGPITGAGILEKVPLPDGGLFITARTSVTLTRTGFFPDKDATVNLDGLCAAVAP